MTNLKTVDEVVDSVNWGWECNENNIAELLTQDRQSACDELVRRLEASKMHKDKYQESSYSTYSSYCGAMNTHNQAIDQALTIVKEVYKVKE